MPRCNKCGMSFDVGYPKWIQDDRTICPERGCGIKFWNRYNDSTKRVAVGVTPAEAQRIEGRRTVPMVP